MLVVPLAALSLSRWPSFAQGDHHTEAWIITIKYDCSNDDDRTDSADARLHLHPSRFLSDRVIQTVWKEFCPNLGIALEFTQKLYALTVYDVMTKRTAGGGFQPFFFYSGGTYNMHGEQNGTAGE